MPQVRYTADGLPYYDATDQQTQPYFAQPTGAMLPAPGNPAQPSEGWNQGVRDTLHGMTIGPVQDAAKALQGGMTGQEAQDFAFGAALGLLPMGRGLRPKLPMDEASRMARAAEQGYTIDAYHGTGSPEFNKFDASKIKDNIQYGGNFYFSPSAEFANKHTGKWSGDTPRMMPVKLKAENPFRMDQPVTAEQAASVLEAMGRTEQAKAMRDGGPLKYWTGSTLFYHAMGQNTPVNVKSDAIRKAGYDAIIGDPQKEIAGTPGRPHIMVYDPDQILSRFAAFDPASKGSGNLLGSILAAAGLGIGAANLPIPKAQAPQFQ
jgi:hypothetical protein